MNRHQIVASEPSVVVRMAKGLGALIALAALVVGVPAALCRFVGWPLPHAIPKIGELSRSLQQTGVSDTTIIKLLAVVVWIAWLRLAVSVAVELAAFTGSRPRRQVWALGGSQRLAAGLIAAVLLTFGGMRSATANAAALGQMSAARGITATAVTPDRAASQPNRHYSRMEPRSSAQTDAVPITVPVSGGPDHVGIPGRPAVATWTVKRNDSFWRIAESHLGDGQRWHEIVSANVGREVAPGTIFDDRTDVIHPGWVLALPPTDVAAGEDSQATPATADAATMVEVGRGDTLGSIAERAYGDSSDWTTVWEANRGRQFGSRTFDDPDLILPGWRLTVPDDPTAATSAVARPGVDPMVAVEGSTPGTATEPTAGVSNAVSPPTTVAAVTRHPEGCTSAVGGVTTPSIDPTGPADSPSAAGVPSSPGLPPPTSAPTIPGPTLPKPGAGQPSFPTPKASPPTSAPTFVPPVRRSAASTLGFGAAALLATGVVGLVGARRRAAMRRAGTGARLAELSQPLIRLRGELTRVAGAERIARLELAVRLAHEHLGGSPGARLIGAYVDADGDIELALSPQAGRPRLPFEPGAAGGWLLPAELVLESIELTTRHAAFPCPALAQIGRRSDNADIDVYLDLEAAGLLVVSGAPAEKTIDIVRALALGLSVSPFAEQAQLVTCGLPLPTMDGGIMVTAVETADEAIDLAADLLSPILGALRTGQTTAELRQRSAGEAWEPALVVLAASRVESDLAGNLPGLCSPPGRGLAVITDATNVEPHEDVHGGLQLTPRGWHLGLLDVVVDPLGLTAGDAAHLAELIEQSSTLVEASPSTAGVSPLALVAEASESSAPAAAWELPPWALMVRTLGPVDVIDRSGAAVSFERAKALELVAWLVEHRAGATRRGARTALWEAEVQDATFANVVSDARRNLARQVAPPAGDEWIKRSLDEHLGLHPMVVGDGALLRQCVERAHKLAPHEALTTLRLGLELVRDAPFTASAYLWPDGEGLTSQTMLTVTDAATMAGEHCLTLGDLSGLFWATGKGLVAVPGHEELIALRMRGHAAAGDLAGVRSEWTSYERVLHADRWSSGEPAAKLLALRHELLGMRTAA